LIRIFVNGLWDEIKSELKLYKTENLSKMMNKAHAIEGKSVVVANAKASWDYRRHQK